MINSALITEQMLNRFYKMERYLPNLESDFFEYKKNKKVNL